MAAVDATVMVRAGQWVAAGAKAAAAGAIMAADMAGIMVTADAVAPMVPIFAMIVAVAPVPAMEIAGLRQNS